jgi:hypothetical protein
MCMLVQIAYRIGIRINNLLHILWTDFVPHPRARTCHQTFRLKLVGIQKIATQRLGIVGFIGDV